MPETISVTPTVDTSAYMANDAVGGRMEFDIAAALGQDAGRFTGFVVGAKLIDRANQRVSTDIVLFDQAFEATADQDAFDPSDGDLLTCIGFIPISSYSQFANNAIGQYFQEWLPFHTADGKLYGQLKTRGAPTYTAAGDLTVELELLVD